MTFYGTLLANGRGLRDIDKVLFRVTQFVQRKISEKNRVKTFRKTFRISGKIEPCTNLFFFALHYFPEHFFEKCSLSNSKTFVRRNFR